MTETAGCSHLLICVDPCASVANSPLSLTHHTRREEEELVADASGSFLENEVL